MTSHSPFYQNSIQRKVKKSNGARLCTKTLKSLTINLLKLFVHVTLKNDTYSYFFKIPI